MNRLREGLGKGTVENGTLDLVWTMVRNHGKSRRMLRRFDALAPEALQDAPYTEYGYVLDNVQLEILRDAQTLLELVSLTLRRELARNADHMLARDLADLNDWWRSLSGEERDIAFEAIEKATGCKDAGRLVYKAKSAERMNLLILALWAVDEVNSEARRQQKRWRALSDMERRQIAKSLESYSGMKAKKWWNTVSVRERNLVLGRMMDALDKAKSQPDAEKSRTGSI
ncbi:hypothetical protein GF391_00760 [Candidatus Uhrbacteria bacterium]|nr:hypothetical protein [Candidatus Uhrbacteria bacterium]